VSPAAAEAPTPAGAAHLPVRFEANVGQTDPRASFVARGAGFGLFLGSDGATLALDGGDGATRALRMRFVAASADAAITGDRPLEGRSSYISGSDPSRWRRDVPAYGAVRYAGLYPGIDAVFYGADGRVEYDLVVAPGADPGRVALAFDGADGVRATETGDIAVALSGRDVRLRAPVAYQVIDGERRVVPSAFRLAGATVRLALGAYDRGRALVVDPVLSYSTYLGGSGVDRVTAMAVDPAGNAYVAGSTTSADFPTQFGLAIPSRMRDAFVAKLAPDGGSLVYSTYLGGSDNDAAMGLAIDASRAVYITGTTSSADFPVAGSAFTRRGTGEDSFVAKLAPDGSSLVWSGAFGGSGDDNADAIAVDASGNVYVTGATNSFDYPTQFPIQISSGGGDRDAFITKLNPSGTALVYSTYLGGSDRDDANAVAVDATGNVVVAGFTASTNFPTRRALQAANAGGRDLFVTSLNATGTEIVYSTYLGGGNDDVAQAIAVAPDGSIFLTGESFSGDFPVEGTLAANAGGGDVIVVQLNSSATDVLFSTFVGGSDEDQGNAFAIDAAGAAYVTGSTRSTNFPVKLPLQTETNDANTDAFVVKINPTGTRLAFSTYFGGNGADRALAVAVDGSGNVYIGGATFSTNLPTQGPIMTDRDDEDGFVVKIGNAFVDLSVAVSAAPEPVRSESNLTYTITVQNAGPDAAGNVAVMFVVPAGTTFVSADVPGGSCTTPTPGGTGTVTCTIPSLASGATATATVVVNVTAPAGSNVDATASVTSTAVDTNAANDAASVRSSVITPVDPPVITSVTKLVTEGKPFRIRIDGSNLQPGIQVFIGDDQTPWPSVKYKSTTRITLKGEGLKARFPNDVPVRIRLVNPDGGEAETTFAR
jgi:uncharacterized repeat protein (TIGR01451 family)